MVAQEIRFAGGVGAGRRDGAAAPRAIVGSADGEHPALWWERYRRTRDPQLRERLILQYAPLVKYVLGQLSLALPPFLDYEDVRSFGAIGLIEAVERFDETQGVKFETYAIARIRGAIIDALRSVDHLPRSVRRRARASSDATARLEVELGRPPTHDEVAEALGLAPEAYRRHVATASRTAVSLDVTRAPTDDADEGARLELPDREQEPVLDALERRELIGELGVCLRMLSRREQLILTLYYRDEITMREIAGRLGVSESRVCQLHGRAVARLREALTERAMGRAA